MRLSKRTAVELQPGYRIVFGVVIEAPEYACVSAFLWKTASGVLRESLPGDGPRRPSDLVVEKIAYHVGQIMVMVQYKKGEPSEVISGGKPYKFDVKYEIYEHVEEALARAQEIEARKWAVRRTSRTRVRRGKIHRGKS